MNINLGDAIKSTADTIVEFAKKNAPQILTGLSLSCGFLATTFAVTGTIKAVKLCEEKKKEEEKEKLTTGEVIKTTWTCYIPTVMLTGLSIFSGIKAIDISAQREAAAIMMYQATRSTLKEYQEKTKEIAGVKKEQQIHDAVNEERVKEVRATNQIVKDTGKGDQEFVDYFTGQRFKCSPQYIQACVNRVQNRINTYGKSANLNDIFEEIGLTNSHLADNITWSVNGSPILMYITYTTDSITNEPIGCVEYLQYDDDPDLPPWIE